MQLQSFIQKKRQSLHSLTNYNYVSAFAGNKEAIPEELYALFKGSKDKENYTEELFQPG